MTPLTFFVFSYSHFIEIEQSLSNETVNSNGRLSQVETEIDDIKESLPNNSGKWSDGTYCILTISGCPAGFTRYKDNMEIYDIPYRGRNIKTYTCCK